MATNRPKSKWPLRKLTLGMIRSQSPRQSSVMGIPMTSFMIKGQLGYGNRGGKKDSLFIRSLCTEH
jgi:hypothetical protein